MPDSSSLRPSSEPRDTRPHSKAKKSSARGGSAAAALPSADEARGGAGNSAAGDHGGYSHRHSAPPREQMGTQYGESRYSRVREVVFKRKSKNKPDALLTLYYDSYAGLRARGVPVDPPEPVYPYVPEPEPFPEPRFAPPPPRRY